MHILFVWFTIIVHFTATGIRPALTILAPHCKNGWIGNQTFRTRPKTLWHWFGGFKLSRHLGTSAEVSEGQFVLIPIGGPYEPRFRRSRFPKTKGQFLGIVHPFEKHCKSLLQCTQQKIICSIISMTAVADCIAHTGWCRSWVGLPTSGCDPKSQGFHQAHIFSYCCCLITLNEVGTAGTCCGYQSCRPASVQSNSYTSRWWCCPHIR